jgi:hypothetical protein
MTELQMIGVILLGCIAGLIFGAGLGCLFLARMHGEDRWFHWWPFATAIIVGLSLLIFG